MWLFTKYGFFSVVCARQGEGAHGQPVDPKRMMVRARVREHLEALREKFPELLGDCDIKEFVSTDYAFRLFVEKSAWSEVAEHLAAEIDYDNFKSAVGRHQGRKGAAYEHSLHEVWSVMNRLQVPTKRSRKRRQRVSHEEASQRIATFSTDERLISGDAYEDDGTQMLFGRLDRAVLNQCEDGEATVSRYAIWANTARDHIAEAMRLIDTDRAEATRLLTLAHNSLSAFSAVQALFDPFDLGSDSNSYVRPCSGRTSHRKV
jgi:hypothetical protein